MLFLVSRVKWLENNKKSKLYRSFVNCFSPRKVVTKINIWSPREFLLAIKENLENGFFKKPFWTPDNLVYYPHPLDPTTKDVLDGLKIKKI